MNSMNFDPQTWTFSIKNHVFCLKPLYITRLCRFFPIKSVFFCSSDTLVNLFSPTCKTPTCQSIPIKFKEKETGAEFFAELMMISVSWSGWVRLFLFPKPLFSFQHELSEPVCFKRGLAFLIEKLQSFPHFKIHLTG